MVRSHLLSLPKVDICQTQNISKHNFLYSTIRSRCFILTPKAISPAESKSCLVAFSGSGQQEEIFYSMAATILRLEGKELQAIMCEGDAFLPLSASPGEVCPFLLQYCSHTHFQQEQACSLGFFSFFFQFLHPLSLSLSLKKPKIQYCYKPKGSSTSHFPFLFQGLPLSAPGRTIHTHFNDTSGREYY